MKLSEDEAEQALYCANELIDRRRGAGVPVPAWMIRLARRLDLTSAVSPRGHEIDSGSAALEPEHLIGSKEAAAILGLSTRQTRRLRSDLDGEMISDRLYFNRDTVVEYAEERLNGRHR
ncbi:hypothetical protein MB901379_03586 [Mycobacterium basiliense]|uniref:Uncharacterized protein n=1 Tax=Mycobacterium basiliense TaxID=2094119 RepID=A0A3S5CZZ3_9MYCO|nr:hypothetical protein [Mycobacterium basiliense]VDM89993.1 hypothetical protein MB901379_03586 [Mycobacterium basiliense]